LAHHCRKSDQDGVVFVFGCWTFASRKAVLPVFESKKPHALVYECVMTAPSRVTSHDPRSSAIDGKGSIFTLNGCPFIAVLNYCSSIVSIYCKLDHNKELHIMHATQERSKNSVFGVSLNHSKIQKLPPTLGTKHKTPTRSISLAHQCHHAHGRYRRIHSIRSTQGGTHDSSMFHQ
jgi:hypothetical protein